MTPGSGPSLEVSPTATMRPPDYLDPMGPAVGTQSNQTNPVSGGSGQANIASDGGDSASSYDYLTVGENSEANHLYEFLPDPPPTPSPYVNLS